MAKDDRQEVAWASFIARVRLSSQSSDIPAIARTDAVRLSMGDIRGVPHLFIEDASLPNPANIPWTNIASVGWVERPK